MTAWVPVGFNYAKAMIELHRHFTYDELAERLGYESKQSILNIIKGALPDHPHGEALWALYLGHFGHKPPHSPEQALGKFVHLTGQHVTT